MTEHTRVYVVMGNGRPEAVFSLEYLAKQYIASKNSRSHRMNWHVHWRYAVFNLDKGIEADGQFVCCPECKTALLCNKEQHCDRTHNGYR